MKLRLGFMGVSALAILHAWPDPASAQSGVTTYTYDALGQLVSSTNPTGQTTTYTYDQAGNRLSLVSVPPAPTVGNVNLTASCDSTGSATLTPAGQYTSLAVASPPANGSASISGTTVTYTPALSFYGSDSFTYTAIGPGGTSNTGTVSVTVPKPPVPTVANVSLSVAYNSSGSVTLTPSAYTSHIILTSNPSHGTAYNNWTTVTYTPTNGYSGSDSFTYTASGPGGTSSTATITVTVAAPGPPSAPTAGNVNLTVNADSSGSVVLTPAGQYTSLAVASQPANGSASISGTTATYTPALNFYGSDSFTYTATGPGGASNAGTVSVTVPKPPAPTVANVSLSVSYNSSGSVTLTPSAYTSRILLASNPSHGSAYNNFNIVTYTPTNGYYGSDSFTYTASGPGGTSSPATISVTVATPSAPTVGNVNLTVNADSSGSVTLTPAGQYTSLAVASQPANGSALISGTTATYTPAPNFYGSDSFTYTATGPAGASNTGTVSVTVPKPPAPTATNVSLSVGYNSPATVTLTPSAYTSHIVLASNPSHGSAYNNWTAVTYTPTNGYSGSDSFTYTASGPGGTSSPATISVTVAAAPAALSASLNQTSWSWVGTSNSTGNVVVTPTGGVPGYTYAWTKVSGSAVITISSASAQSVYWTKATNPPDGVEFDSVWQCVVTDSAGNKVTTQQVSVDWTDQE